ncbi:hypothetical protein STEG23_017452, partial [Scotinomys teguina]
MPWCSQPHSSLLGSVDTKTISSISSRSYPYSSESDEESAETHSGSSAGESSRSSSSHDLQENEDQGKFHFPVEESLEAEIEEQEITKVGVDNGPPLTEVECRPVTEEEPTEGNEELTEEPKTSRQSAAPEAKAKSQLQEGGTAVGKDSKAGLPGLEEEVGQITGEAQPPEHYHSHTAAGLSTTEDGETPRRKLEVNLGRAVEERAAISSNEQPEQAAQEVCTPEKETTIEDECSQSEDADTVAGLREKAGMEEDTPHHPQDADMDVGLREKSGIAEIPLGKKSSTEMQAALAEQSTKKGECPLSTASEAETGTEEHSRPGEEQINPTGKVTVDGSLFLSVEQALDSQRTVDSDRQGFGQTVMEKGRAVSEREPVLEKAVLPESAEFSSETPGESAVLKELGTPEVEEVEQEAGSTGPEGDQGKEGALTELENMEPMEDTAPEREDGFEEAILGGEKAATEKKKVLEAREAGTSPREVVGGNSEELCKVDTAREGVMADRECILEQDPTVVLPRELTKKVERPPTPPRETGSEREEVTGVKVSKTEEKLEEQKVKGEEEGTVKGVRSVEEGTVKGVRSVEEGTGKGVRSVEEGTVKGVRSVEEEGTVKGVRSVEEEGTVKGVRSVEEGTVKGVRSVEEEGTVKGVRSVEEGTGKGVRSVEEEGTMKRVRSVEDTQGSPNKTEADPEDINPTGATEFWEDTRLLEDSPKALSTAILQFEKLPGDNEATATEHQGGEELPDQESEAPRDQGRLPSHDGKGLLGAPGPEPAGKTQVPEHVFTARGQEWASKELDSLEGPERLDEDGPLQLQRRDIMMIRGNFPEGELTVAQVFSGEAEGEKPQEEGGEDREYPAGSVTDSPAGQNWAVEGGTVEGEEDPHGRGVDEAVAEHREVLAESVSTSGDSVASSSADAQKETWNRADEVPRETAAEERVTAEDMTSRTKKVAVVEEVTSAGAVEIPQEQKSPEVQDSEGGGVKASQHA